MFSSVPKLTKDIGERLFFNLDESHIFLSTLNRSLGIGHVRNTPGGAGGWAGGGGGFWATDVPPCSGL